MRDDDGEGLGNERVSVRFEGGERRGSTIWGGGLNL